MKDDDLLFAGQFLATVVAGIGWFVTDAKNESLERQAIMHGYALYCPQTGEWAWKGECDD